MTRLFLPNRTPMIHPKCFENVTSKHFSLIDLVALSKSIVIRIFNHCFDLDKTLSIQEQDAFLFKHGLCGKASNRAVPLNRSLQAFLLFIRDHKSPTGRQKGTKWRLNSMKAIRYEKDAPEDTKKDTIQFKFNETHQQLFSQGLKTSS